MLLTSEPEARELLITILMAMMVLAVVDVILVILLKNRKCSGDFGAGNDFLGVALAESIDKRSMFGLDTTTNR